MRAALKGHPPLVAETHLFWFYCETFGSALDFGCFDLMMHAVKYKAAEGGKHDTRHLADTLCCTACRILYWSPNVI